MVRRFRVRSSLRPLPESAPERFGTEVPGGAAWRTLAQSLGRVREPAWGRIDSRTPSGALWPGRRGQAGQGLSHFAGAGGVEVHAVGETRFDALGLQRRPAIEARQLQGVHQERGGRLTQIGSGRPVFTHWNVDQDDGAAAGLQLLNGVRDPLEGNVGGQHWRAA